MIPLKRHANIALFYFVLVGLLGLFLRLFFVIPLGANFRYVVHAHSHIALLGWVYLGLTTLIYRLYFQDHHKGKVYRRIFIFTNITVVGMLVTFPFTGYAALSITFSTLFLISSYFFGWFVFKNIPPHFKSSASYRCIRAAIIYLIVSSIGPWAIGAVMATLGNTSIWYHLSIYFYLHFQYNAWFILALTGFLLYIIEKKGIEVPPQQFNKFFRLFNAGLILSLFLSALWTEPPAIVYLLAGAGALFQAWAVVLLLSMLRPYWPSLKTSIKTFPRRLLVLAFWLFVGKVVMQIFNGIPFFATLAYHYPDLVIGYLHWIFLGVVSIALLAYLHHFRLIRLLVFPFWIYLCGFIASELLIFYRGIALWLGWPFPLEHPGLLLGLSALMPLTIYFLFIYNYTHPLPASKEGDSKVLYAPAESEEAS